MGVSNFIIYTIDRKQSSKYYECSFIAGMKGKSEVCGALVLSVASREITIEHGVSDIWGKKQCCCFASCLFFVCSSLGHLLPFSRLSTVHFHGSFCGTTKARLKNTLIVICGL